MSERSSALRGSLLSALTVAFGISVLAAQPVSAAGETAIRPFQVHVPEAALVELRKSSVPRSDHFGRFADHQRHCPCA